jgi:hypothetical protein
LNPANVLFRTAARLASVPLGVALAAGRLGLELEEQARGAISRRAEQAFYEALDAIVTRLMEDRVIDRVLERAEAAGVAQHVADRILEDGIAEQIAERAFSGPELERIVAAAFKTALPDELVSELLASEAVWILVDEIARSPSVTEAIAHQGTGFLDQVAAKARDRSRRADDRVLRLAERLRRRSRRGERPSPGDDIAVTPPLPGEGT